MNTQSIEAIKQAAHTMAASARKQDFSLDPKHGGAIHYYTAPDGVIIYVRLRLKHPGTGDKWIRPLRRDTSGVWCELKAPEFEGGAPLYNLHRLCDPARQPMQPNLKMRLTLWFLGNLDRTALTSGRAVRRLLSGIFRITAQAVFCEVNDARLRPAGFDCSA